MADVVAELLGGISIPFPPNPGAYMAVARDGHGTAVEVYPAATTLMPNGVAGTEFRHDGPQPSFGAVHFALSVELEIAEIEAIAEREGWRSYVCSRGGDFDVVELWLENRFLVELLPPAFAASYVRFAGLFASAEAASALMASHERQAQA